jgi:outer membrane protein assembly factor BamB
MRVKYWEIIVNKIIKAGFSVGWVSALDSEGQTIWIGDAHRGDGKRFVVCAEGNLKYGESVAKGETAPVTEP